ncbi:aldehyde dehydrogenase family protein [Paraflavitalea soli]|uniref:aldehyde dehydrogenase (NAD(+)) n=1 Tax=Paraflavitalea soli TaxID=2315862 RepID=A0A3B7ME14_9BACT|nr:aldehyde dehydrogenase family protein [Paraflavitalea soli]AXY72578.1 aldehyde dehydrogenase family protein [Paraflavitalea soli]
MKTINQVYINGQFTTPHGEEVLELLNPATHQLLHQVILGDEQDVLAAIASAKQAFNSFSRTTKAQRMQYLQQLHDAIIKRVNDLQEVTIDEYGATRQRALWSNRLAAETFLLFKSLLADYSFEKQVGGSTVVMEPLGVEAILTAWNSNSGSICVKLAAAIAAGCTVVIKPSEFSAGQTQVLAECFHAAGLPAGVINIVNGRGNVLGPVLSSHPDVALISFTGSTQVGKQIARNAIDTMKRVTLELSGKSPNILLDDADLATAVPLAVNAVFNNNGQACIAGSRLLVPEHLLPTVKEMILTIVGKLKVGDPRIDSTDIGPLASVQQYERIQQYIRSGIESGAELLIGGPGRPDGLSAGNYVRPTVFANVTPDMKIAQEEIFGPVLSILTYRTEAEAIAMANDTIYGLLAYVSSSNEARALEVARQLKAGRVLINTLKHDPLAPFGGYKQSGIGREGGIYGLEACLEPKALIR